MVDWTEIKSGDLEAEVVRLREALEPFANATWRFNDDGFPTASVESMNIVHRARALFASPATTSEYR